MIKKIKNFIKNPENFRNTLIIKYHILKAWQKFLIKYGLKKDIDYLKKDTFNWSLYNIHYRGEIKQGSKEHTLSLKKDDYRFADFSLIKVNENIKALHFNHCQLYETILQLNPESIFELGCGNGMHLHNIQILMQDAKLYGIDLLAEQLNFLHESYPDLKAELKQLDATIPFPIDMPKVDLVFSQAVLMHIYTNNKHLTALVNMFEISKKYIVLFESPRGHDFISDIKKLHDEGQIRWDKIFFYYRINKITKQPGSIICSKEPLSLPGYIQY